jgi:hypothetical protein
MPATIEWLGTICTVTDGVWTCEDDPGTAALLNVDVDPEAASSPSVPNYDLFEAQAVISRYSMVKLVSFTPTPPSVPGRVY